MKARLSDIIRVSGGRATELLDPRAEVTGVTVDSRRAGPGIIFAALKGKIVDGHDFIAEAIRKGAPAALCSEGDEASPDRRIVVDDVEAALARIASFNRDVVDPIVVGITGSIGKTSTKDYASSVAARKFRTVATERSYNNEVGVPLTLLSADPGTEVLVVELAARGRGQIAELCEYVRPQVGVVTNVGVTHIEVFGSQESIARTKSELIASLPEGGVAVLNADDELAMAMKGRSAAEVLTFGLGLGSQVHGQDVRLDSDGMPSFEISHAGVRQIVQLQSPGRQQVPNALAAAAVGIALGLSLEDCAAGLESAKGSPFRMEVSTQGGITFLNDAWNAGPDSVAAAIETCSAMRRSGGRLIAILGFMAELGHLSEDAHLKAGRIAAAAVDKLIVVGHRSLGIAKGAMDAGLADVVSVEDAAAAVLELTDLKSGDLVLVKASRSERLEGLVDRIKTEVVGT